MSGIKTDQSDHQTFDEVLEEFSLLKVSKPRRRKTKHPQMHNYKYLLVIDFEATCWDPAERKKLKQEIIEFPACLVNLHTGIIEDEFRSYCKPTEMPILSEYCKELTGIQQEWVESGMLLEECIQSFTRWLKIQIKVRNLVLPKTKRSNPEGNCLLVSWSNWDFMICLNRECSRKKIRKPSYFNQWMDLKEVFSEYLGKKEKYSFPDALKLLAIDFEGSPHCGLDDARNCCKLAVKMHRDNAFFRITKDLNQHDLNRHF